MRVLGLFWRCALAALFTAPVVAQASAVESVHGERGIEVSVRVEQIDGTVVYDHLGKVPRVQASNTKLLTTAAALLAMPADHRWTTQAQLVGDRLWIRGDGDPSLRRLPDRDVKSEFLDGLAAALDDADQRHLTEIIFDDRAFDREARPPLWPQDQWQQYYCAGVGALTVEGGLLEVRTGAGQVILDPDPGSAIQIKRIRTDDRKTLSAWWSLPDQRLIVAGSALPERSVRLAVKDPMQVYAAWLVHGLQVRGIKVEGWRLPGAEEQAPAGEPLWQHRSAWNLREVVLVTNKTSDNFLAEALLKTLGALGGEQGTTDNGLAEVRRRLAALGVPLEGLHQTDGSGMSRSADGSDNCASPAQICALLRAMATRPQGTLFFDSLVVGGQEGRLKNLFRDPLFQPAKVRCKTGWINGASSLAGYAVAPDGTTFVFSTVVNYIKDGTPRTNNARFRKLQEEVVRQVLLKHPAPSLQAVDAAGERNG